MQKQLNKFINEYSSQEKGIRKQVVFWIWYRVLCFLAIATLLYFFGGHYLNVVLILCVLVAFIFGVQKSAKVDAELKHVKKLIAINQRELKVLAGEAFGLSNGKEYSNPAHENAFDLDLLAPNGVFEALNRSASQAGQNELAQLLLNPWEQPEKVVQQQSAVKELSQMPKWRQHFMAHGVNAKLEVMPLSKINVSEPLAAFVPNWLAAMLPFVPVVTVGVTILFWLDVITASQLMLALTIPLMVVGSKLKKITILIQRFESITAHVEGVSAHLKAIENTQFKSEKLQQLQQQLHTNGAHSSEIIQELKRSLDSYYQRSNILIGIVLNAFLLWDIKHAQAIFKWQEKYGDKLANWLHVVAQFDALNSLANFAYTHPQFIYPEVEQNQPYTFYATNLKHPLLPDYVAVGNDFESNGKGQITIVTGANMAGKSTFLRTLGVNIILASLGLPVSAKSMQFYPLRVFTSMRTNDSLANNSSFFHAEISRLAQLFKLTQQNQPRFVILDEILKGTNSEDKARGSYAFVKKLMHYNIMGVIATHDLSLCQLADEYAENIINKSFEVLIENNELHFDYTLRNGVCQNLNASFLLKKMGLVDSY